MPKESYLTKEDMIFLAKLPLSDEQLTELLKWASTYEKEEKEEKPKKEFKSIFQCIPRCGDIEEKKE